MKRVVCKRCGVAHDCGGRLSNKERAVRAATAREWPDKETKLEAAKEALAEAPQPKVARTVKSLVPASPRGPSDGLAAYVRREDLSAAAGERSIRKSFAETARAFDYKCSMHRKDTKGCQYCDLEHGRMAND